MPTNTQPTTHTGGSGGGSSGKDGGGGEDGNDGKDGKDGGDGSCVQTQTHQPSSRAARHAAADARLRRGMLVERRANGLVGHAGEVGYVRRGGHDEQLDVRSHKKLPLKQCRFGHVEK